MTSAKCSDSPILQRVRRDLARWLAVGRVAGEFILMPPLVFRTGRDNAAASDKF